MRHIKITAFIAVTAVSATLLTLSLTPFAEAKPNPIDPAAQEVSATFIGIDGMVFRPGQNIEIKWALQGEGVKYFETNSWGECELFFSSDDGANWMRITPHMAVTTRKYWYTLPNVATQQARFALQIGIEGEGDFFMFPSQRFTIRSVGIGRVPSQ